MVIRRTVIALLLASTLLAVSACNLPLPQRKPDGPATYALVRLRHESRVEMLTLMKTFGEGACDAAIAEFLKGVYSNAEDMEGWKETERDCRESIKPLYVQMFNDEPVHATYLKLSVRGAWEYESRIVLYGVPASQALPVCEAMARSIKDSLSVSAECILGTEG